MAVSVGHVEFCLVVAMGAAGSSLTEIRDASVNNKCVYNSNTETGQNVAPVVLVVGDAGHQRVPSEREQDELDTVTQQFRTAPRKTLLKVNTEIEHGKRCER